jgi:hypothetical protein|uniref:Uncharacterized protein n=1 Tax=viral metagenome TaxID=1070528 RepID=A0A6C0C144_9ZZZZ|tara:strand:- start:106 stop:345 length:240 start_codon:yes stop_codon:yes gene_type:complete
MGIRNVLHSKPGQIIISVLLGLGLSTLFRKVCNNRSCIIFKAAPLDKVKDQIFKFGDKCYKYKLDAEKCSKNKKTLNYA